MESRETLPRYGRANNLHGLGIHATQTQRTLAEAEMP